MTPQELKEIALNSSKEESKKIEDQLHEAAKKGYLSCEFIGLPESVISDLEKRGFIVTPSIFNMPFMTTIEKKHTVSFS